MTRITSSANPKNERLAGRLRRGRSSAPLERRVPLSPERLLDPEVQLMLRVQRDEPAAFAELIEVYWAQVLGRFYHQLGDWQEAEDRAQEVFLRLYRSRKRYVPSAKFSTWLFHIIQNVARNALRTRRRRPCVLMGSLTTSEEGHGEERLLTERPAPPSQLLERTELAGRVRAAVARLGGRQRRAMELYQFHDRSYDEIAAEMDTTLQATKSLLSRARHQLRECLGTYLEA